MAARIKVNDFGAIVVDGDMFAGFGDCVAFVGGVGDGSGLLIAQYGDCCMWWEMCGSK